jgi:beta-glucuronidase
MSSSLASLARHSAAFVTLCLVLVTIGLTARAQHPTLIQNIDGRKTTSLDGLWHVIVDPYETGYYDYRYQPSPNGYFKDVKPKNESDLIEYDFDTSETLRVPGDWNSQKERFLLYEGTIWYKQSFDYHKTPDTRLFIYFGAANYLTDVYLNGEKLVDTRVASRLSILKSLISCASEGNF